MKQSRKRIKFRLIILTLVPLVLGLMVGAYLSIVRDLPPAESISFFMPPVATKVYDDNDNVFSEFFIERRELTNLDRVPKYLKDGFIAIEDKRFYHHWGVDIIRFAKSLFLNLINMRIVQGGSTITMQLARNMFLTMEQTLVRKAKEMALAIRIERAYTKDEILEKYLNQINFGQGRYGVATAARYYFDKDISELTLTECALLIAIPRSPEYYSPYRNPEHTLKRRNLILQIMHKAQVINDEEYENARQTPISVVTQKSEKKIGEYFLEEIRRYLELKYGPEFLYRSGAKIYTTLNHEIQKNAEEILEKQISALEKQYKFKNPKSLYDSIGIDDTLKYSPYLQGALVITDHHTGEVKALIGGRDFSQSKWNRATQAARQAGSAFKIFVFVTSFDNGFNQSDVVLDLPIVLEVPGMDSIYRPSNYDRKFLGPITLRDALKHSRNLAAIRLIRNIGPDLVVRYAHNLGVESPLLPVVSLALGSCEVNLLEMVGAISTIANLGEQLPMTFIRKITDKDGTLIEISKPIAEQKLNPQTSYIMIDAMRSVVDGGTGYRIRHYYRGAAAGKTGTTNNYSDAWFIGFNPQYACGVWIGYDNNDRIFRGATGGEVAAPIWGELMAKIDNTPGREFPLPGSLTHYHICNQSGMLATNFCPKVSDVYFIKGSEPVDSCDIHSTGTNTGYQDDFDRIEEPPSESTDTY